MNDNNTIETALFQEIAAGEEREKMLDANALRSEERDVKKPFTEDEKDGMRKELSRDLVELNKLNEAFKKAKKAHEEACAPLKTNVEAMTKSLRAGFIEVKQDVYLYDYQEQGIMATYDRDGNLLETRRLMPEEKQTNVISMARKTGTND